MSGIIFTLLGTFIFIAFIACLITSGIKVLFFLKINNAFTEILAVGLIGEIIGFFIMGIYYLVFKERITASNEPEEILAIPFYNTLVGLLIGTLILHVKSTSKQKI